MVFNIYISIYIIWLTSFYRDGLKSAKKMSPRCSLFHVSFDGTGALYYYSIFTPGHRSGEKKTPPSYRVAAIGKRQTHTGRSRLGLTADPSTKVTKPIIYNVMLVKHVITTNVFYDFRGMLLIFSSISISIFFS